jgi:hypothetical protein
MAETGTTFGHLISDDDPIKEFLPHKSDLPTKPSVLQELKIAHSSEMIHSNTSHQSEKTSFVLH